MTTKINVKNAFGKIEYTKFRLNNFYKWDAQKKHKKLKIHCISTLCNRLIFLEKNSITKVIRNKAFYDRVK